DNPKPATPQEIRRQPEIHQVKDVEELRPKLQRSHLPIPPPPERCVLDQRHVVVLEARPPERVASQRPKPPMIWPRPARHVDRHVEERRVVRAPSKIVLAHRTA